MSEKTYDIRFLAAWPKPATQPTTQPANPIVRILYGSVAPTSWKVNGGTAELKESDGLLIITTTEMHHQAIGNLIANLKEMGP